MTTVCEVSKLTGGKPTMDFSAFDTKKIDEYAARARAAWGSTPEYRGFEEKSRDRSREGTAALEQDSRRRALFIF